VLAALPVPRRSPPGWWQEHTAIRASPSWLYAPHHQLISHQRMHAGRRARCTASHCRTASSLSPNVLMCIRATSHVSPTLHMRTADLPGYSSPSAREGSPGSVLCRSTLLASSPPEPTSNARCLPPHRTTGSVLADVPVVSMTTRGALSSVLTVSAVLRLVPVASNGTGRL